jgi:DNA-binding PadR family transcriptional regulator
MKIKKNHSKKHIEYKSELNILSSLIEKSKGIHHLKKLKVANQITLYKYLKKYKKSGIVIQDADKIYHITENGEAYYRMKSSENNANNEMPKFSLMDSVSIGTISKKGKRKRILGGHISVPEVLTIEKSKAMEKDFNKRLAPAIADFFEKYKSVSGAIIVGYRDYNIRSLEEEKYITKTLIKARGI